MTEPIQVTCPQCQTANRVPRQRLGDRPRCGKCKGPLFTGQPLEFDEQGFERAIRLNDLPLVVDFWAPWCGPCRTMAPHFEACARQLEPEFRLAKVNTEQTPALANRFGIRSIPTLIAFHRGREVGRFTGALSAQQLMQWIRGLKWN